jgi:peptidoglycan/LPS O-acetylase OafA/YrhL
MMAAGAAELALVRGKISHPAWRLATVGGLLVSGAAILIHEQNGWLYSRAAFLHHAIGWTVVAGALIALARVARPRSVAVQASFALVLVVVSVFLYSDRDTAPIFGHLSPVAGEPHR